jgi:hypothetical protein
VDGNGRTGLVDGVDVTLLRDAEPISTIPEEPSLLALRRHRRVRRISIVALFALLALGAAGLLGVRTRTTTAHGGGYDLKVTYGQVSRPGLPTAWSLEIHHPGGFAGPVTVATSSAYLDLFDENGFDPEPAKVTATGDDVIWQFDPPPGDRLVVSRGSRVSPGVQWGKRGTTSVLVDGRPVVTARYKTWILP